MLFNNFNQREATGEDNKPPFYVWSGIMKEGQTQACE